MLLYCLLYLCKLLLYFSGVLKLVIDACKEGASARSICELGDKLIIEETSKVYKKEKEMKKGFSFILFV